MEKRIELEMRGRPAEQVKCLEQIELTGESV